MNIQSYHLSTRRSRGFSLIEVMVAVVILATGLLALAALQAAITRNAADARSRSQVAAFVDLAIEQVRASAAGSGAGRGFVNVPPGTGWVQPWTAAEVTALEARAGVSNLSINVSGTMYEGRTGSFVVYPATSPALSAKVPQYKELDVVATWNDATGTPRRYELTAIISPRTTIDSGTPFQQQTSPSNNSSVPVVRTATPVEPGVIPIAIGNDRDTAATNPKPTISSGNVIRTSYEVLTYRNLTGGDAQQQKRVETAVIGCSCQAGTAPASTDVLRATAQWPAYWNGERYTLYTPNPTANAPGVAAATGPATGVTQDILCTECCRDHHDNAGTGHVKFDPFRTDAHTHYTRASGTLAAATGTDPYLESCRMIRVDGFWRTAQDLDVKHFGLLETTTVGLKAAKSPLPFQNPDAPVNSATEYYESFVIDFLKFNYLPGQTPQSADALYESKGLNAPARITISRPSPVDERYLHTRGLYVDKLESEAISKVQEAALGCPSGTPPVECILPLLPFTGINLTEPAFWSSANSSALTVDSDGFLVFNTSAPNRGRVNALVGAPADALVNIVPRIQKSNSGVAQRDLGIDPQDDVDVTDTQEFLVPGGPVATGGSFTVRVTGLPTVTSPAGVAWTIGTVGNNCQGSNYSYTCNTTVALGTVPVRVTVAGYNTSEDVSNNRDYPDVTSGAVSGNGNNRAATLNCPNSSGPANTTPSIQNGFKGTVKFCANYRLSSPTAGVQSPPSNSGLLTESTYVDYSSITQASTQTIGFAIEGYSIAPISQCTFNGTTNAFTGATFSNCP